jgi:asparagine synthase (glutamine-hydrolysing)
MCGISGIFGQRWQRSQIDAMVAIQRHRGPDANGVYISSTGLAGLGHNRLSIIDLSDAGRQPMSDRSGRYWIVFNGEIYNYIELRRELEADYEFRTNTDTEVLLASFQKWGERALDRLIGMFAFMIWDESAQSLFAARDRFGVKPLYLSELPGCPLLIASEIKTLFEGGAPKQPDEAAWATYLAHGHHDHGNRTFWKGVSSLSPGHWLKWKNGYTSTGCWYDLAERVGPEEDQRAFEEVQLEYRSLLLESVKLRFRADVPVGINLSGGVDSSTLLGLVQSLQGPESEVKAFTFVTGDPQYDELPWVQQMLTRTRHSSVICKLEASQVPGLAESVQFHQDEPFGGLPTLAYARLFEQARAEGVIVLLDGQGLDEQWAGYDYYLNRSNGGGICEIQGTKEKPVKPECLVAEFRRHADPFNAPRRFADHLRNSQYRDARYTKIPRALRFNDRVSMRSSTELREPFLDHRLFELAMRQPEGRKIMNGSRKMMLRQIARDLLPASLAEAPKRALQTPQREWLRGPLREWATDCIEAALAARGREWLDEKLVRASWRAYCDNQGNNSFYVWQWINLGLMAVGGRTVNYPATRSSSLPAVNVECASQ